MTRVLLVAALIASTLALAKEQRVLDRSGLFGACTELAGEAPGGGRWLACRPGELTGYPDLTQESCTRGAMRGDVRYWVCPTSLVAARSANAAATR